MDLQLRHNGGGAMARRGSEAGARLDKLPNGSHQNMPMVLMISVVPNLFVEWLLNGLNG